MSDNTYTDLLKRCAAIQEAAITGLEASHYSLWEGARFPYMTNMLGPATYENDSEQIMRETRAVTMRLVIGHLMQSGYSGESEDKLGDYLDDLLPAFQGAPLLISATYTTAATYLHPLDVSITADGGLQYFTSYLGQYYQVGTEITLTCELYREI